MTSGGAPGPGAAAADLALLALLAPLLATMAYFSFVETTFSALTPAERLGLRRAAPSSSAIVERLLAEPRQLLVTTMIGSLAASTAYLVVSSVLATRFEHSIAVSVGIAAASLFGMILSAEVLPKLVVNADRARAARVAARPTALVCAALGPLARALDRYAISPLSRLVSSSGGSRVVDANELAALLLQSAAEGSIDVREREALAGVMRLRTMRVRDVMTPRVDMVVLPVEADDAAIERASVATRLSHVPLSGDGPDEIAGILDVKRFLIPIDRPPRAGCVEPPRYVPDLASLEQLLDHFRRTRSKLAIAVDEYGGVAGIVALEDCVEEIVGDIASAGEQDSEAPVEVAPGIWRASGDMGVARWSEIFGARVVSPRTSTVAGLVLERLARLARPGDAVTIANLRIEVESVTGFRIRTVLVSIDGHGSGAASAEVART